MKFSVKRLVILLFFGSLVLGQLGRMQITPSIAVYIHDVLLGVLVVTNMPLYLKYAPKLRKINIIKLLGFFILSLIVSLLAGYPESFTSYVPILHLGRFILYSLALPTFYIFKKERIITHSLQNLLAMVGGGLMISGIIQYLAFPDMREYMLLGWDNHYYRSVSSLLDPNFFGLIMVLFWVVIRKSTYRYARLIEILSLGVLFFTYSRSAYVAFVIAAIALGMQKKSKKVILMSILSIVVAYVLLPRPGGEGVRLLRTASIYTRLKSQNIALEIFKKNPIAGVGFNAYSLHAPIQQSYDFVPSHPSSPDNSLLLILSTSGVLGMATFLLLTKQVISIHKKDQVVLPSIAAIGAHSLFNNSIFYPWVILWLYVLLAQGMTKERSGQK